MTKRKLLYLLGLIFTLPGFPLLIVSSINLRRLDILERETQIDTFGFYKSDITIRQDLYWTNVFWNTLFAVGVILCFILILLILFFVLDDLFLGLHHE